MGECFGQLGVAKKNNTSRHSPALPQQATFRTSPPQSCYCESFRQDTVLLAMRSTALFTRPQPS